MTQLSPRWSIVLTAKLCLVWLLAGPGMSLAEDENSDPAENVIKQLLAAHQAKTEAAQEIVQPEPPQPVASEEKQTAKPHHTPSIDPVAAAKARQEAIKRRGLNKRSTKAGGASDTASVVDGIAQEGKAVVARNRREALFLLQQAEAAAKAGDILDALRLAQDAKKLYPDSRQIVAYALSLEKEIRTSRLLSASHARAKAHLALGLTHASELMRSGRYADAESLLEGVIEASLLFPAADNVGLYRRMAQKQLDQYHSDLRVGLIALTPEPGDGLKDQPKLVATGAAAPKNLRRLLRGSEGEVPLWYAQCKNRLATEMTVDYKRIAAALVFEDISKASGVQFVIDEPVSIANAHLSAMVDLRIGELPAETLLDLVCQAGGLEYVIMQKAIVITTPAKAVEYVRQLPDALRYNWAVARVLFPELNPQLLASGPQLAGETETAARDDVPAFLGSGSTLVEEIQKLLR